MNRDAPPAALAAPTFEGAGPELRGGAVPKALKRAPVGTEFAGKAALGKRDA
jgi:hypothetical protein